MAAAIETSHEAWGRTSPNPPVGCVVLDADGVMVGAGPTEPPGGPHAEVIALRAAGERARGGTAVVTLEPCAHTGRTPPCTEALIEAGVARVVYSVEDPNPKAAGGAAVLTEAGIAVESGLLATQAKRGPLRAWLHSMRTGRPHVTWKFASTVDGRVAAADGTSRWISGEESRAEVHELRRHMDAIMVGLGTVATDDPQLTARAADGSLADRQPLRVIVGRGEIPPGARVLDTDAETLHLRTNDPDEVLDELGKCGVVDVLLEGGPRLAGAFVRAGAVHRVLAYIAPKLLGDGSSPLVDTGMSSITQALSLDVEEVTMSGSDVRISAVPAGTGGTSTAPREA
ncbi:bifunctional diaminohydroxyphosphoribosylaminopyrimidine deaminase/5-amino-6-(5-phosphoribosylamino)uracil reductase RibD [Herbihabitans rhizosphaerae]|nr:bifunctional diaminohydroxyphosphoribosylaminopyrimidine deaminase/5-amino-6-(5-phosphoribosylamino)uracil reductase RibD [Herbihabitans rhizosphaerae]